MARVEVTKEMVEAAVRAFYAEGEYTTELVAAIYLAMRQAFDRYLWVPE